MPESPENVEIKSAATVEGDTIHQTIGPEEGLEIKSDADGQSYVEGYIATKDSYKINGQQYDEEALSEEALKSIADQINSANNEIQTADVTFPDPDAIEKTTGNLEHQSTEKMERLLPKLASTATVPAVRLAEAKFDGYGTKVKAPIRENALPDDVSEAVKQNIKEGILSAFSVEFKNAKDKFMREAGSIKRKIKDVDLTGAGLTAAPKNPNAVMTATEIRSVMAEAKSEHKSVAGVRFIGTRNGKLDESRIDKEEHELGDHYLFGEGEDKEDYSYPVVDADGYLRRGNVEAAYSLGDRGGVDADELDRKLKELNDEFESPPIEAFKEDQENTRSDNMPEDPEQGDGESEGDQDGGQEQKSDVQESVEELKSTVDEVKSRNEELQETTEELKEENEELRSQLEDYEEFDELKSDVDEIEEELKSLTSDDQPVSDPEEQKNQVEDKTPGELKAASAEFIEEHKSELADKHNMTEEEVLEHAE